MIKYKEKIKLMIFDFMYAKHLQMMNEEDHFQFEVYFEQWWEDYFKEKKNGT